MQPLVTIVVCTKNRPQILRQCLSSIYLTRYSRKECLLVDSSHGNFAKQVAKMAKSYAFRYMYQAERGVSAAKNLAITRANGDILCFTDDDCVVGENWVENLIRNYNSPEVKCVTGRTIPEARDTVIEKFFTHDKGLKRCEFMSGQEESLFRMLRRVVPYLMSTVSLQGIAPVPWCIGVGNNCSFRKDVFESIELFDEGLGAGSPKKGGEDLDVFYRIYQAGFKLIYEPNAVVYHVNQRDSGSILMNYGKGGGHFMLKHFHDPYIALQFLGRFVNVGQILFRTLLGRDKKGCHFQLKYLNGLFSSIMDSSFHL
ncbi:MAG: glycosyltransferase family 2 protein [Candidatus Bathyarchaeia archaeon]